MSQPYLLVVILSCRVATNRLNKYGIQVKVKITKRLKYQKVFRWFDLLYTR